MLLRASVRSFSADLLNTRTVCCQSRLLAGSWRLQQTCSNKHCHQNHIFRTHFFTAVFNITLSSTATFLLRTFLTSRMGCWPRYFGLL